MGVGCVKTLALTLQEISEPLCVERNTSNPPDNAKSFRIVSLRMWTYIIGHHGFLWCPGFCDNSGKWVLRAGVWPMGSTGYERKSGSAAA